MARVIDFDDELRKAAQEYADARQRLNTRRDNWKRFAEDKTGIVAQTLQTCFDKLKAAKFDCYLSTERDGRLYTTLRFGAMPVGRDSHGGSLVEQGASLQYAEQDDGLVMVCRTRAYIEGVGQRRLEVLRFIDPVDVESLNQFEIQEDVIKFVRWALTTSTIGATKEYAEKNFDAIDRAK